MARAKVFLNGVVKSPIKHKITTELERGIDTAEVHFPGNVLPAQNDKVLILLDAGDLTNLQFIAHFEGHTKDESGYGRDGVATDITYDSGPYGPDSSAVFNGSTSKIVIANDPGFTLAGQFDIQVKFKVSGSGLMFFLSKRTTTTNGIAIFINQVAGKVGAKAGSTIITSNDTLNDDAWHTVRFYRNSDNLIQMDIDNVTQNDTATVAGSLEVDTSIIMGQDFNGSGSLNGRQAHPRVYTGGVLSAIDAKNIFKLKNLRTTIKFGGRVWKVEDSVTPRIVHCKSFGKEVGETTVIQKVYNMQTVDDIAQDLIETNTALEFVKGTSTGGSFTLEQFVAKGYLLDLMKILNELANTTFYTDGLGLFHWTDNSAAQLPLTYTHGSNAILTLSGHDDTQLANKITVKARDVTYRARDTFTGDGSTKVFNTSFIITDPLVTVDGVVQNADEHYTINTQNQTVTFINAPSNDAAIVVEYSYDKPITIQMQDDDSIIENGVRGKDVFASCTTTIGDATRYGALYLQAFKDVKRKISVQIPKIDVQVESNGITTLVNSVKNINGAFVIKSVTWEYPGITTLDCGEFTFEEFELHKQIVSTIHHMLRQRDVSTQVIKFRNLKEPLNITDTVTKQTLQRGFYNSNTFYSNTQVYAG